MSGATGYLVVANANAGSAAREALDLATGVLAGAGPVQRVETDDPGGLDAVLRDVGGRVLVVAGGDGSLHLAVGRLDELGLLDEVVVALLPLGTGNDLARGLGLPLEPGAAAARIRDGEARALDLLRDDAGGVAVNVVHAGLGAEAAEHAARVKDGLGPVAYPVGALIASVREPGWDLAIEVDGRAIASGPTLMVGICNGRTVGGGTPLCPVADPEDGRLDVVVVAATGPAQRVAFARALRRGEHLDRPDVTHARGTSVTVRGEGVRFNADGEVSDPVAERTYEIVSRGWRLVR